MGTGWSDQYLESITVPQDAAPTDARIYIGPDDPYAIAYGLDASLAMYWADRRLFLMGIEAQFGNIDEGAFHLWSIKADSLPNQLFQIIDIVHHVAATSLDMYLGLTSVGMTTWLLAQDVYLGTTAAANEATDDVFIFGRSIGRGCKATTSSTASSGAIIAETVVLTAPARDYYAGRCYEVRMTGGFNISAVNTSAFYRVRKTNVAGQVLGEWYRFAGLATSQVYNAYSAGLKFTVGGANVNAAIALCCASTAATAVTPFAGVGLPRTLEVWDVGSAADFASQGYPVLV